MSSASSRAQARLRSGLKMKGSVETGVETISLRRLSWSCWEAARIDSDVAARPAALGRAVHVRTVDGTRAFRRRLLEMGLVPGVEVRVVTIAPLGDPLRIEVRHGQWSIRKAEAAQIEIETTP